MPRPNYPLQGGPYPPAWSPSVYTTGIPKSGISKTRQAQKHASVPAPEMDAYQPLSDNLEENDIPYSDDQTQTRQQMPFAGYASERMVWIALAVFGLIALFAIMAVQGHG